MGTSRALWKKEIVAMLRLGWPLVIVQLAQMAFFTTDVVMMGWLGPEYLAAGSLATAFFHPLLLFGVGVLSAVTPMVAQALGQRSFRQVRRATRQGCWVAIAIAALLTPVIWHGREILLLLGQTEQMAMMAERYLHYAVWVLFPALIFLALRALITAHGSTAAILWITLGGVVLNALCNYAVMFGNWGFPRLELMGAGITTSLVNLLMCAALIVYVQRHKRYRRYHVFARFWRADWVRFRQVLRIGLPFGLMLMAEVGLFATASLLMGWLGTSELAAHAIAMQCAGIAFMVPLGLSHASTIRVGLAYGRGDKEGIARAGWVSIGIGMGFMACSCLLLIFIPEKLIGLFLDPALPENKVPFALAVAYLGVAAMFQLADGAQVMTAATLRGMTDTRTPMLMALAGYWMIGLPISYYCGFVLEMRGLGVWYGLAGGLLCVALLLVTRFTFRERLGLLAFMRGKSSPTFS